MRTNLETIIVCKLGTITVTILAVLTRTMTWTGGTKGLAPAGTSLVARRGQVPVAYTIHGMRTNLETIIVYKLGTIMVTTLAVLTRTMRSIFYLSLSKVTKMTALAIDLLKNAAQVLRVILNAIEQPVHASCL